jgi:hypothetical protein
MSLALATSIPSWDEIDPPIGYDALERQQRMGGKEPRHGRSNCALESERAALSNKSARLCLHSQRRLLGSFGLDDRGTRMLEDLLAHLDQTESPRRPIEQPYAEPLFQQGHARPDSRFGHSEHRGSCREPAMKNDGRK